MFHYLLQQMETWNTFHTVASLYQTFYRKIVSYDMTYKILLIYIYIYVVYLLVWIINYFKKVSSEIPTSKQNFKHPTSSGWCYRWRKIMNCKAAVANTWHNVNITVYKNPSSGLKDSVDINDPINLIFSFYNKSATKTYSKNVF